MAKPDLSEALSKPRNATRRKKKASSEMKPVHVGAYFDPEVSEQLTRLQAELMSETGQKVKVKNLLTDALNLLFKKHGKPPIA